MIDSHCHLDHEPLLENITEVLTRSKNSGIIKILTICTTINGFKKILYAMIEKNNQIQFDKLNM